MDVYFEESAREIMTKDIVVINFKKSVGDVQKLLMSKKFDNIDYIYIINNEEILVGVVSIKELFRQSKNMKLEKIMVQKVHFVKPSIDQEKVVEIAMKYNIKAVPVVDKGKILGVVPHHVILGVLHKEGIEDLLHKAGIHRFDDPTVDLIHASDNVHFKKRLPWLLLGLIGGVLAALIVGFFEEVLSIYIVLAAFIPAIVYMAGAIGNQTQTIFIRSMALEDIKFKSYFFREVRVSLLLALILSIIFYLVVLIGWNDSLFAFIIGTSIFVTALSSVLIGVTLPVVFKKFDFDPAISSGPLATAIIDLTSLLIYFGIAQILIYFFL